MIFYLWACFQISTVICFSKLHACFLTWVQFLHMWRVWTPSLSKTNWRAACIKSAEWIKTRCEAYHLFLYWWMSGAENMNEDLKWIKSLAYWKQYTKVVSYLVSFISEEYTMITIISFVYYVKVNILTCKHYLQRTKQAKFCLMTLLEIQVLNVRYSEKMHAMYTLNVSLCFENIVVT